MPLRSDKNEYRGVNAHLHSRLQRVGDYWIEFHAAHIVYLANELRAHLRDRGYTVAITPALQVQREEDDHKLRSPRSDALIYDPDQVRASLPSTRPLPHGAPLAMPLAELFMAEPEPYIYKALVIYRGPERAQPVTWIELLSPSNKPGGSDAGVFQRKRYDLLESGLGYVEIDYLHESPPTFDRFPSYCNREPHAQPYRIVVLDPRPQISQGMAYDYHFGVDDPIPTVTIPLSGDDTLVFDFGIPYNRTFTETFYGDQVDYAQLPEKFDSYSPADQARIREHMAAVKQRLGA